MDTKAGQIQCVCIMRTLLKATISSHPTGMDTMMCSSSRTYISTQGQSYSYSTVGVTRCSIKRIIQMIGTEGIYLTGLISICWIQKMAAKRFKEMCCCTGNYRH